MMTTKSKLQRRIAGKTRTNVNPDEFMFMGIGGQGRKKAWQFKHRKTRNYLHIPLATKKLVIPKGGAFHRGEFDA